MSLNRLGKLLSGLIVTIILVTLLVWIYCCQVKKIVNPKLYGSWDMIEVSDMGMKAQTRLLIDEHQIKVSNTCFYEDKEVFVLVESQGKIYPDEIHILEDSNVQKEYSPDFLLCKASIEKTILKYELINETLSITMPGSDFKMQLVRSEGVFNPAKKIIIPH